MLLIIYNYSSVHDLPEKDPYLPLTHVFSVVCLCFRLSVQLHAGAPSWITSPRSLRRTRRAPSMTTTSLSPAKTWRTWVSWRICPNITNKIVALKRHETPKHIFWGWLQICASWTSMKTTITLNMFIIKGKLIFFSLLFLAILFSCF